MYWHHSFKACLRGCSGDELLNHPPSRSPEESMSSACPCPSPRRSPAHPNRNQSHRRKPKHELLQRSACAQAHQRTPSCSQCSPCHQTNSNEASWYPPRQSKRLRCAPQPGSGTAYCLAWSGSSLRPRQICQRELQPVQLTFHSATLLLALLWCVSVHSRS